VWASWRTRALLYGHAQYGISRLIYLYLSVQRAWAYTPCAPLPSEALARACTLKGRGKGGEVAHRVTSRRNLCSDAGKQLCACKGPSWARGRGLAASGGARGGCRAFPPKPVSPGDGLYLRSGKRLITVTRSPLGKGFAKPGKTGVPPAGRPPRPARQRLSRRAAAVDRLPVRRRARVARRWSASSSRPARSPEDLSSGAPRGAEARSLTAPRRLHAWFRRAPAPAATRAL
jgi:hypothetical protein